MKKIKVKKLRAGDIILGNNGIEYEIESIESFDNEEMFYWAKNCETGISGISSSSKEAKANVVKRTRRWWQR